jgi:DNA processing protein
LIACDTCLRRSALLGTLAPYIARALDEHRRLPALLALDDEDLLEAVCGAKREAVDARLGRFDPKVARREARSVDLGSICHHSPRFPEPLRHGADAPAMLYVRGEARQLEQLGKERAVAIVGSRRASPYGIEVAQWLARELAACDVPVVSGLALGIDSAAHQGALAGGGLTVAVLAGGADLPYPRSKRHLYERIARTGAIVSELPPGLQPFRWCFPARNRVMAGLSCMTVVVEGTASSGSLITARFAADLGREVGAGPNDLLADGATVVRSAADVLDSIYGAGFGAERLEQRRPERALDRRLRGLLEAIEQGKCSVDAIADDQAEVAAIVAGLTELELLGLIRRGAGGSYVRLA